MVAAIPSDLLLSASGQGVSLDTLDVVKKAEDEGGTERREIFEEVLRHARDLGCIMKIGGGRAGGINLRYGAIGYAVLDINTKGVVKVYASPHPGKDPEEEHHDAINNYIDDSEELVPKSFPVNTYGHLEDKLEEIGPEPVIGFVNHSVDLIRKYYYEPWFELHEA